MIQTQFAPGKTTQFDTAYPHSAGRFKPINRQIGQDGSPEIILAPGSPMEDVLRLVSAVAGADCPVFLRGESGCGKEMVARHVHLKSNRAGGPFVAVNCAALPAGLIESELFGHKKGAFTGAHADHPGTFRTAHGGTLLLDEIGDMPREVQTRLLRVLQEKKVCPVGDSHEYPVDFRLVCATHRDLRQEVAEGRFREDLYYRLNVVEIRIPPLRERPHDILPLVQHFLSSLLPGAEARVAAACFPRHLLTLSFPGNIRELKNLVERYSVMRTLGWSWQEAARTDSVAEKLPPKPETIGFSSHMHSYPSRIPNSRVSEAEITHALATCGQHRSKAATLLGISRRALQYRLAKMTRVY